MSINEHAGIDWRAVYRRLRTARAADHSQIVNLREARENVVLNSIGEKCVRLVIAKIFERKHGNRFVRPDVKPAHLPAVPEPAT